MSIELSDTNSSQIAAALLAARRKAGSPAMGMVLTLIVVTDEGDHYDALKAARTTSREHPSRILGVIRRSRRGAPNLDAEIRIGDGASGESVLLRMSGELANHAESVVLPLLLPDSPVVVWWPGKAPEDPAADPLGALAQRRITDMAAVPRARSRAMLTQALNYTDGNTDLAWTRLTPWRALLAAALDQYPATITSGFVEAEKVSPSADLLVAWLCDRLDVPVERGVSKGPGITAVSLETGGGPISITRPDGRLARFSIPNAPDRPVALKRRAIAECLAEELRRLDPDDVYEETVTSLCRLADRQPGGRVTVVKESGPGAGRATATRSGSGKTDARKSGSGKSSAPKAAAKKSTGTKKSSAGKKPAGAKKSSAGKAGGKKAAARKAAAAGSSRRRTSTAKKASSRARR